MKYFSIFLLLLFSLVFYSCTQEKPDDKSGGQKEATETATSENGQESKQKTDPLDEVDEFANEQLEKMFDYLASAQRFSVDVTSTFDVMQSNGQLIQFGADTEWIIKRAKHVLINSTSWDGDDRTFYFDGKQITYYDSGFNVYATAQKEGDIDQAFDYFVEQLNMPLPLTELFSVKHPFDINTAVKSSIYVGESTLSGIECNEFAFRFPYTDLQIWIKDGKKPLPIRTVITYKNSPGEPQYATQFSNWNFTAVLPDKLFEFTPPKDARKIIFAPQMKKTDKQSQNGKEGDTK